MKIFTMIMLVSVFTVSAYTQMPKIEPGVPIELAQWRAAHYSDVRYKLDLTLEKMSPVLKGTIEIRVTVGAGTLLSPTPQSGVTTPIILDWRKLRGHEELSTITNVVVNGVAVKNPVATAPGSDTEHLVFREGVVAGENVIKLDFTSPILTSGSAITRYIDKEDGSEYLYSLFVPSDASTAFPVFDQPDLKATFYLEADVPKDWKVVSNSEAMFSAANIIGYSAHDEYKHPPIPPDLYRYTFLPTKPISTYVFAFAAGPWEKVLVPSASADGSGAATKNPSAHANGTDLSTAIYVRKSQAAKFKPHAAEVFRLNREAIKYFEQYFDYKFPFPKYDLVLIPEFPFGGMEHAGATFLRESSIIFPTEPTQSDKISRAILIFHETAHQWFGDTVTMRWFDDLWLKEGFANFAAYKALEKIMPEANAWKVFYERIKQSAYATDSTKGTTPIYQEIKNLSAAKSAYGNIVYSKAPAFLRQAEFYLGEDKFQTAVRAFLRKFQYKNATWEDLVKELNKVYEYRGLPEWASYWVSEKGVPLIRTGTRRAHVTESRTVNGTFTEDAWLVPSLELTLSQPFERSPWALRSKTLFRYGNETEIQETHIFGNPYTGYLPRIRKPNGSYDTNPALPDFIFPNYGDYGYGIFLLDEKSRDYVLKNIQNEKDPFLRSMMWGALWDAVREGELSPSEYVRKVVQILGSPAYRKLPQDDESTIAMLLSRVGTATNYYLPLLPTQIERPPGVAAGDAIGSNDLGGAIETMLMGEMQREGSSLGRRLTFYRAFLSIGASENARSYLKQILAGDTKGRVDEIPLKTKDKFDIVTRLIILGDPDGEKLLAELEKTETGDDAKRWAYAAKAGIPTAENKAKYWNDFVNNKEISESWIEAAFGPWNSIRHSKLTLPYLQKALQELPNHKRDRKIFFVNGWLGAFIGGQRSEEALGIINKFLADNPSLDNDLRLKILENADIIERATNIRAKYGTN